MKKILIIEDDFELSNELKILLDNNGYQGIILQDSQNALENIIKINPDLILLDIKLPYLNGQQLLKQIRKNSNVPIIMVTSKDSEIDEILAMSYGADDYITKPFSTAELLARIRGNYRRIQYIQNNQQGGDPAFHNGSLTIDYQMQTVYVKEEEIHVTPIEYKILCLLAKNLGRVLTHTHITKEIWGSSLEGDIASLRVHVATVRKKIEKKDSSNKCIQTHVGIGYCMVKQD